MSFESFGAFERKWEYLRRFVNIYVCPYVLKYTDSFYFLPYLNLLKINEMHWILLKLNYAACIVYLI